MAVSQLRGEAASDVQSIRAGLSRQRRWPLTATGVFLLLMSALIGGLVFARAGSREPVIIAARDIAPGQTVGSSDVRVARLGIGDGIVSMPAGSLSTVIGKVAQTPIAAGSVLAPAQIGERVVLPAGRAVVGVLLGPGALPAPDVAPNDRVQIIVTPAGTGIQTDDDLASGALGDAVVWRVSDPSSVSRDGSTSAVASGKVVSLLVDTRVAASVASAASNDRIRLVLLGGSGS